MQLINITRTHYLEDCIIEGYKGYFHQWEIKIEGAKSGDVLKLCKNYCREAKFTKEQFLRSLEYSLKQCKDSYRAMFNVKSFYELKQKKNGTWIYTCRYIQQDFV